MLLLLKIQFLRINFENYIYIITTMDSQNTEYYMLEALVQAKKAWNIDEVPIGAIIVKNNKIIARAHNQLICNTDPSGHAEIIAIREAAKNIGNYRLVGCDMYVTLEPCLMCLGAIFNSRITNLSFGAYDLKTGVCESILMLGENNHLNHHCKIKGGILEEESKYLLGKFFEAKRQKKPPPKDDGFSK